MSGDQKEPVLLRFVCRLRGGSQPILAEASDGLRYVVKFANQPQGPNLLFNESIGTELYRRAHLTVPAWRPLRITESFVCQNQSCWLETPDGFEPPQTGLCFGSCHLGSNHIRLYELLSGRGYLRVRNRNDFWIAWLLDVCAFHADNRQAVFCQGLDGKYCGAFIDQGHMFGGPKGEKDMSFAAPAYLDRRIYPSINFEPMEKLVGKVLKINYDRLWSKAQKLPEEWKTDSAFARLSDSLSILSCSKIVENIFEELLAGC